MTKIICAACGSKKLFCIYKSELIDFTQPKSEENKIIFVLECSNCERYTYINEKDLTKKEIEECLKDIEKLKQIKKL